MPDQPRTALTTLGMRTHSGTSAQMAIHCPLGEGLASSRGIGAETSPDLTSSKKLLGDSIAVVCGSPRSI